jgi:hypothetical protein
MFSNNKFLNQKDEMLRLAFQKIKQENNLLNEKITLLEKRISLLEKQETKLIKINQEIKKPIVKKIDNIEKAKANLTNSEKEILNVFTVSKEKSYTYEELGLLFGKSSNTVKAQIQSIIKKGINLSFNQNSNSQRSYYLDEEMFELVVKAKN